MLFWRFGGILLAAGGIDVCCRAGPRCRAVSGDSHGVIATITATVSTTITSVPFHPTVQLKINFHSQLFTLNVLSPLRRSSQLFCNL